MKKIIFALLITLATISVAAADTIYLRGGTTLRGTVLGFINGRFAIQLSAGGTLQLPSSNNRNQGGSSTAASISAVTGRSGAYT